MVLEDAQRAIILRHANRLLDARDYPKTICPSEIARALSAAELGSLGVSQWRDAMSEMRQVMWESRADGEVEILQKGNVVDANSLDEIKGPIRVRKVQK